MKNLTISAKITIGFTLLLLLTLLTGGLGYINQSQMLNQIITSRDAITITSNQLGSAVEGVKSLQTSMGSLQESEQDFQLLLKMNQRLDESRKATVLIGEKLKEIEQGIQGQTQNLLKLQQSGQDLQREMVETSGQYFELLRAVEDINGHVLSAYLGFFNYLNEYSADVKAPLSEINKIATKLQLVNQHIMAANIIETAEGHPLEGAEEALQTNKKIKKLLRRFEYYMQELGETTSTTQITELNQQLRDYGGQIIAQTAHLRTLTWGIADHHNRLAANEALAAQQTAETAVSASKEAEQVASNSLKLANDAGTQIRSMADELSVALKNASKGLSEVPQALEKASQAAQVISQSFELMHQVVAQSTETTKKGEQQRATNVIVLLVSLVLGITTAILLFRAIVPKLIAVSGNISTIERDANLTLVIKETGPDEVGEIGRSLNSMLHSFKEIISGIEQTANSLTGYSSSLARASDHANRNAANQTDASNEIAHEIDNMGAMVMSISSSAELARQQAEEAAEQARNGNQTTSQLVLSIETLEQSSHESLKLLQQLIQSVNAIVGILDSIRGIAEQTNLLALNAAIEAARAGEQGRGFAVVADEVRTLATRTQDSVNEIDGLIINLQNNSSNISSQIENHGSMTHGAVKQAAAAGGALHQITQAVSAIVDANAQIAQDTVSQQEVADTIHHHMEAIQELTSQTSLDTQQTKDAAVELEKMIDNLHTLASRFKIE